MSGRKYSVSEIDQMRRNIEHSYPSGVAYYAEERSKQIEDRLRTYMLNGTEPSELAEMCQAAMRANQQQWSA